MGGWGKQVLVPVDICILDELMAVEANQMVGNTNCEDEDNKVLG